MRPATVPLLALVAFAIACAHSGADIEMGQNADPDPSVPVRLVGPDGDVVGDADLTQADGMWRLEIGIRSADGTPDWRGFVVRGDCEKASGRVVQIDGFAAADGGIENVTTFPAAWLKPGTPYAIHILDGEGGTAACGDVGEVRAATPSVTGR